MIPRLFPASATTFTTNGITTLTDTISCVVTEERNGVFELEMVVATTTPYFDQLVVGALIVAKPNHTQTPQAFEIYEISKPINQRVTVRANHISYRASYVPVVPFSTTGITATIAGLTANAMETNPFTIVTDITNEESSYNQTMPGSLRSRLGGTEGSLLDVFGGEYLWDNFTINLLKERGDDNGVQLRLAKNITDLEQTLNFEQVVTGALPYWVSQDGLTTFFGDVQYSASVGDYDYHRTVVLDLSDEFETAPSNTQLNDAAQQFLLQASLAAPKNTISVNFIDLADTEEYKNSPLERVNLCDTVQVIYPALNISYSAKCVKVVFDVLAERTLEVDVGDARTTMGKTISDLVGDSEAVITIGKKLVSITQIVDRDLGEITQRVSSVEEVASDNSTAISNLSTTVSQNDQNVQIAISNIQSTVNEQGEDITELHEYITFDASGVTVGKSDSDIRGVFGNNSLDFVDSNDTVLAWLSTEDGLGATELSVGDATTKNKRWRIITSSDGSHLRFTRHS